MFAKQIVPFNGVWGASPLSSAMSKENQITIGEFLTTTIEPTLIKHEYGHNLNLSIFPRSDAGFEQNITVFNVKAEQLRNTANQFLKLFFELQQQEQSDAKQKTKS